MNIGDITGYLSKYQGEEVDAAVERVQGIETELEGKVDKTQRINGHALRGNVTLNAQDVGALSSNVKYGSKLSADGSILSLKDQDGNTISSTIINTLPQVDGVTITDAGGVLAVNVATLVVQNADGGQLTINGN